MSVCRVFSEWGSKKKMSDRSVNRHALIIRKVNEERPDWIKLTEGYSNPDNHSVQLW